MTIQHNAISDPDIHEPKGVATADAGTIYVADGLGSGTWSRAPYGFLYFENFAVPYVLTYPAVYTKATPTTTPSGVGYLVTEHTDAKLTYGGPGEVMDLWATLSLDQATGANRDIELAIYKNGVKSPGSGAILTTISGQKRHVVLSGAAAMVATDYVEVYIKNAGGSGDVNIYNLTMFMDPH